MEEKYVEFERPGVAKIHEIKLLHTRASAKIRRSSPQPPNSSASRRHELHTVSEFPLDCSLPRQQDSNQIFLHTEDEENTMEPSKTNEFNEDNTRATNPPRLTDTDAPAEPAEPPAQAKYRLLAPRPAAPTNQAAPSAPSAQATHNWPHQRSLPNPLFMEPRPRPTAPPTAPPTSYGVMGYGPQRQTYGGFDPTHAHANATYGTRSGYGDANDQHAPTTFAPAYPAPAPIAGHFFHGNTPHRNSAPVNPAAVNPAQGNLAQWEADLRQREDELRRRRDEVQRLEQNIANRNLQSERRQREARIRERNVFAREDALSREINREARLRNSELAVEQERGNIANLSNVTLRAQQDVAKRESDVAHAEARVAEREAAVVGREDEVTRREQEVDTRQRDAIGEDGAGEKEDDGKGDEGSKKDEAKC